jgi:diaminopimelate epimerase
MKIETGNGVLSLAYTVDHANKVNNITVDMGEPVLVAEKIPVHASLATNSHGHVINASLKPFEHEYPILREDWHPSVGLDRHLTAVSMGNPHITIYCKHGAHIPLETVGPLLEHDKRFPKRINVHFVHVHHRNEVTMRTWERGSGITLACGTGASAVCVAGVLTGKTDRKILAHLPGGDLTLEWRESDNHVYMTGPATEVFEGEWNA